MASGTRSTVSASMSNLDCDSVPRVHSLFDLETDKVLKLNQDKAEPPQCPHWTDQKYKICGSFKTERSGSSKASKLSQASFSLSHQNFDLFNDNNDIASPFGEGDNSHDQKQEEKFGDKNLNKVDSFFSIAGEAVTPLDRDNSNLDQLIRISSIQNVFEGNSSRNKHKTKLHFAKNKKSTKASLNLNHDNMKPTLSSTASFFQKTLNESVMMLKRQSFVDLHFDKLATKTFSFFNNFNSSKSSPLQTTSNQLLDYNDNVNSSSFSNDVYAYVEQNEGVGDEISNFDLNMKRKLSRGKLKQNNGRNKRRGKWSDHEDQVLNQLANDYLNSNSKINFRKISEQLPGRTAKQCREHWLSTLNPELKKGRWLKSEEKKLLQLMVEHGKQWSIIAKEIPGRAEHSVKAKGRLMLGERLKTIPSNCTIEFSGKEDELELLKKLHSNLGADFDEISKQCGQSSIIISPAKAERTLMETCGCECTYCSSMKKVMKEFGLNANHAWTQIKSKQLLDKMDHKTKTFGDPDFTRFGQIQSALNNNGKVKLSGFSRLSAYSDVKMNDLGTDGMRSVVDNEVENEDDVDFDDDSLDDDLHQDADEE